MKNEIWKDIPGYEGYYQASSMGRIRSIKYNIKKIRISKLDKDGYRQINLSKDGKIKFYQTHRLIALTFIDNPELKSDVDHINNVRDDNSIDNLQWLTHKENMRKRFLLN